MKKILFITTLFILSQVINLQAQELKRAPLNPEYMKYIKQKKAGKVSPRINHEGHGMGFVPSPMYYNTKVPGQIEKKKLKANLPEKYDLREEGYLTSVKDQGSVGSCWTFGVVAAIESAWLKLGYPADDLSEENMATCHGFEYEKDEGGNYEIATAYLSDFSGPLSEEDDPYIESTSSLCKEFETPPVALVPESRYISGNPNHIKETIIKYGGVVIGMHVDANTYKYFNSNDNTFYYNGYDAQDHGVMLVGWDDNKVVTGGSESPDGEHVGAWIAKNSWGTDWGDEGYFYISYKDTRAGTSLPTYFPLRWNKEKIDKIFMYDQLGAIYSLGDGLKHGLVKFNTSKNTFVSKVGTFIVSAGTVISINIYKKKSGNSLQELIASKNDIYCDQAGYYTFDIPALIPKGDFYVKIKYSSPYSTYPIPVEAEAEDYANPTIESGVCWVSEDSSEWEPVGEDTDSPFDICIRAYTKNINSPYPFFTANKKEVCLNSSVTFTENSEGNITDYTWDFGDGADPSTADTRGPHEVSYSSTGPKTISLTVDGPDGSNTATSENIVHVVNDLKITFPYPKHFLLNKGTIELTAFGDADSFTWSPSVGLNKTTGRTVTVSPVDTAVTYTVTGAQGTCSGSDQFTLYQYANDNICDAIEVGIGVNGIFTNQGATIEENEPQPPINHDDPNNDGCNTQSSWCDEYMDGSSPLDHTVWYTFTAPASGKASFKALGFDTQMAIYDATSCSDILDGNYTLIAANDDYYGVDQDYAAGIELLDNLTPGKQYWLQVDGSGGGKEGLFFLIIYESPLEIENNTIAQDNIPFTIFPNPGRNTVNIEYTGETPENIIFSVLDITGKTRVQSNKQLIRPGKITSFNLEGISTGIYLIRMQTLERNYYKKIMVH